MSSNKLLEAASQSLDTLIELKKVAVKIGDYQLAYECRTIEKELYPETQEEIDAKEQGKELNLLFRMVGLNIDPETSFKIFKTVELFKKKKKKLTLMDTAKVTAECNNLFIR